MINQIDKGLQMLVHPMAQTALSTLNSEVALEMQNLFVEDANQGFLVKKIKYNIAVVDLTAGDCVQFLIAPADMSIAEVRLALITTAYLAKPTDPTDQANQLFVNRIWHEATRTFSNSSGAGKQVEDGFQTMGGGKGIPITATSGMSLWAFNPATNNMTTGARFVGHLVLYGVWLDE